MRRLLPPALLLLILLAAGCGNGGFATEPTDATLFEGVEEGWKDQVTETWKDFAAHLTEEPFWRILGGLRDMGRDEYRRRRDEGEIVVGAPADLYKRLQEHSGDWRFRYVAFTGEVLDVFGEKVNMENPGEVTFAATATLRLGDGEFVRVHGPFPWADLGVAVGARVRIEGVFYKILPYNEDPTATLRPIPMVLVIDAGPVAEE